MKWFPVRNIYSSLRLVALVGVHFLVFSILNCKSFYFMNNGSWLCFRGRYWVTRFNLGNLKRWHNINKISATIFKILDFSRLNICNRFSVSNYRPILVMINPLPKSTRTIKVASSVAKRSYFPADLILKAGRGKFKLYWMLERIYRFVQNMRAYVFCINSKMLSLQHK